MAPASLLWIHVELTNPLYFEPQGSIISHRCKPSIFRTDDMKGITLCAVARTPYRRDQHLVLSPGRVSLRRLASETRRLHTINSIGIPERGDSTTIIDTTHIIDRQRRVATVEAGLERIQKIRTRRRLYHTRNLTVVGLQRTAGVLCHDHTRHYHQRDYNKQSFLHTNAKIRLFPDRLITFSTHI